MADKTDSRLQEAVTLVKTQLETPDSGEAALRDAINRATRLAPDIQNYFFMDPVLKRQDGSTLHDSARRMIKEFGRLRNHGAFIISYAKCGRTWLRLMIADHLSGLARTGFNDSFDLSAISRNVLETAIDVTHDDYPHWKHHEEIYTDKSVYAKKKILFLCRDPRDVIVSNFFEATKRDSAPFPLLDNPDLAVGEFIDHPIGGLENIIRFYNSWAQAAEKMDVSFLHYEDLVMDTGHYLEQAMAFLGIPPGNPVDIDRLVEKYSFNNMHKMEKTGLHKSRRLLPGNIDDPESYKVRRGKIGGYVDYLSQDETMRMDERLEAGLDKKFMRYR